MTQMNFNVKFEGGVKIDIGVTPQLEQLMSMFLATKKQPQHAAAVPEAATPTVEDAPSQRATPQVGPQNPQQPAEPETPSEPTSKADDLPYDEPQQLPPPTTPPTYNELPFDEPLPTPTPPTPPKVYDMVMMRKIMEDTRTRLIGPAPGNKSHPLYKRLNGQFKTEASIATGGRCDTPSMLPELGEQYCIAFENACATLAIDPITNDIITQLPF